MINITLNMYLWWAMPHTAGDKGPLVTFRVPLGKMPVCKPPKSPVWSKVNIFSLLYFAYVLLAAACCQKAAKQGTARHSAWAGAALKWGLCPRTSAWHKHGQERATKPWQFHGALLFYQKIKLYKSLITKSLKFVVVLPQENNCTFSCRRGGEEKRSFRSAVNVNFRRQNKKNPEDEKCY